MIERYFLLFLLLFAATPILAGSNEDPATAYSKGDFATTVRLLRPLAEGGNPYAQVSLGMMYEGGEGVAQDATEASKWFRKAADQGLADAQYFLGMMYFNGYGVPQNYVEALKWCRKAAEQGSAMAQYNLGAMYGNGTGIQQDYVEAAKWYRMAAEQGLAVAQYNVGWMYGNGKGMTEDSAEAMKWYRKAAEQGLAVAQYNVASMYAKGRGLPQDYAEAVKWYRKAAEQGDTTAQNNLGQLYYYGTGVPRDYVEALKWYRMAAERGLAPAQFDVGTMYSGGEGVPRNYVEAAKWYRRAADQGDTKAQYNLGLHYAKGNGVPKDYVSAYFWLNLAATYAESVDDQTLFASARETVARVMTAQQIARAQDLGSQWHPKIEAPSGAIQPPQATAPSNALPIATGTGFYVSPNGHALTNAHVVERCGKIRLRNSVGTLSEVSLISLDTKNDLALLKSPFVVPAFARFTGKRLQLGQSIVVYGFPLSGMVASTGNFTTGNVAGVAGPGDDVRLLQISAPVQPGNSGSPVLDASANVIGVVVSKLDAIAVAKATQDIPQNINFAIRGNLAMNFLESRGVEFTSSSEATTLSPEVIGERAMRFTVRVECLR